MPHVDPVVANRIRADLAAHNVVLYMKGTPVFPQCGSSAQAVQILNILGVRFKAVDVLADPGLRQGIKDFSNWPMLPQIYIKGEFIGSADILREMLETGELQKLLVEKGIPHETRLQVAQARMAKAHTFWLMPAEPQKSLLHKTVCDLAREFDAPEFDPHVTFFVAEGLSEVQVRAIIDKTAPQFGPMELEADRLEQSERYSKTLFIQFRESAVLRHMFETAKHSFSVSSTYALDPHISLLYKHLTEEQRQELCHRPLVPMEKIRFDSICAGEFESPWTEKSAREYRVVTEEKLQA